MASAGSSKRRSRPLSPTHRNHFRPAQKSQCPPSPPASSRGPSNGSRKFRYSSPPPTPLFSPRQRLSQVTEPVGSNAEVGITDAEFDEPEPDLQKAPENFVRVFSIPKSIFSLQERSGAWHFGFAHNQNVQALLVRLDEETERRKKAEKEVRELTERLNHGLSPVLEAQPTEEHKTPQVHTQIISDADSRSTSSNILLEKSDQEEDEVKEDKSSLVEQYKDLLAASEARNMNLFDQLGIASKTIQSLEKEIKMAERDKADLEKQLRASLDQNKLRDNNPGRSLATLTEDTPQCNSQMLKLQQEVQRLSQERAGLMRDLTQSQKDHRNEVAQLQEEAQRLHRENVELEESLAKYREQYEDNTQKLDVTTPENPENVAVDTIPVVQLDGMDLEPVPRDDPMGQHDITMTDDVQVPLQTEPPEIPATTDIGDVQPQESSNNHPFKLKEPMFLYPGCRFYPS
ncbi:hypothetical protein F53441_11757 [Fusarium austroafricanum]|uniref:Uncharacterized protein n=1 Tax=Fusarium austroafricanum TaxID=2364996 RepID=A0A8H4NSC7_9HYPO|nr:hypothetical protein F53441_11757 [Fusarium austroafricanum]